MRALAFATFLFILSQLLIGCGQKGPLYMPETPSDAANEAPNEQQSEKLSASTD